MSADLRWHYGPTEADPDPGKMWCYDCGSEVFYIKAGPGDTSALCSGCHRTEPDDPPEYDPEAAAADQAEEWAAGQAELAAIEAESDEARDARAEAAAGAFDPDALGDPDSRPVGA